ncbi:hypothetical protein PAMP_022061 [Pampus punctatissimus]
MLLMLVSLLCWVTAAKACLQCDRRIRLLHEDFSLSAPTVIDQIELKKICDYAYVTYRETSQERRGVIEYPVQAEEGGQAVLNCFLPWHRLLLGKPEYHYSWAPGVPGTKKLAENDFKALVVTADSSVVLNQLHVDEQGTYRCSLLDQNGTNFYRVTFLLTVAHLPAQTRRPLITLPSPPLYGDNYSSFRSEDLLMPIIAMLLALSLAGCMGLTFVLRFIVYNWTYYTMLSESTVIPSGKQYQLLKNIKSSGVHFDVIAHRGHTNDDESVESHRSAKEKKEEYRTCDKYTVNFPAQTAKSRLERT